MKQSHEENINKVCVICFKKKTGVRQITNKITDLIILYCLPKYNISDVKYPKVICHSCRVSLEQHTTNKNKKLPIAHNYNSMKFKKITRKSCDCMCSVCIVALEGVRYNPHCKKTKNIGRPKVSLSKKTNCKRCVECLLIIGKGVKHPCNLTNKVNNLRDLITDDKSGDHVIAEKLRQKIVENKQDSVILSNRRGRSSNIQ